MKYSIFINPKSPNSSACEQAFNFLHAIKEGKYEHINIFFYGYAVDCAFFNGSYWKTIKDTDISLLVCSTIAQGFIDTNQMPHDNFFIAGLGQWMEVALDADKRIEFI